MFSEHFDILSIGWRKILHLFIKNSKVIFLLGIVMVSTNWQKLKSLNNSFLHTLLHQQLTLLVYVLTCLHLFLYKLQQIQRTHWTLRISLQTGLNARRVKQMETEQRCHFFVFLYVIVAYRTFPAFAVVLWLHEIGPVLFDVLGALLLINQPHVHVPLLNLNPTIGHLHWILS